MLAVPDGTVVKDADGRMIIDLVGAGSEHVVAARRARGPRQPGPGVAATQGPRLRPARRAGRDPRRRPRAEVAGRRRPHRLPVGGQVVARLGHLGRAAQDRRLPLHHPRAQPRRRRGGRRALHRRRRARTHPRRPRGPRPRPGVPAARRALLGAGARHRLRHPRARPRPDDRPRRHRARAVALRARRRPRRPSAGRAHPRRRAQQGRRARGPRARRDGQGRPRGPRAARSTSCRRWPAPVCAS